MKFYVETSCGGATFENEADAISAIFLLAPYHSHEFDGEKCRRYLARDGIYEAGSLAVRKIEV